MQGELLESSGPGAAAKAVARHAPTVILRPIIGASRAVGTALLGVGNQVDKEGIRRMEDVSVCSFPSCAFRIVVLTVTTEIQKTLVRQVEHCGWCWSYIGT